MLIYVLSGCFCATSTRLGHCHKEYTARHTDSVDYQALYRTSLLVLELEDPMPVWLSGDSKENYVRREKGVGRASSPHLFSWEVARTLALTA